jgi:peptidyl-prolyl cis-trans isomerase A (cyclophilin A)
MKMIMLLGVALLGLSGAVRAQETPAQPPAQPEQPAERPEKPAQEGAVHVLLNTTMGDIVLELNREKAPISTQNFLAYTEKKAYDGTIFHRVIPGFMVQGGGYTADMVQKPTDKPIKNEWQNGLKNKKGTVAMARLGGRADSATSQFFINVNDNDFLDTPRDGAGYAVFGKVVAGMDVVQKIEGVPTTTKNSMGDVPVDAVVIKSAKQLTPEEAAPYLKGGSAAGSGSAAGGDQPPASPAPGR